MAFMDNRRLLLTDSSPADQLLLRQHLAFTLFVPAGRADRAALGIAEITKLGLLDSGWCGGPSDRLRRITEAIRPYVRFYRQKAERLVLALGTLPDLQSGYTAAIAPMCNTLDEPVIDTIHSWLQVRVKGMGDKATAHFMRNVGLFTETYAYPIIDTHIHKALEAGNFKHGTYTEARRSFIRMSAMFEIPPVLMDAYIWCTYSGNWNPETADFSNFNTTKPVEIVIK